jgi:16S rRNA (guanine527-N7)-methyltransferase
MEEEILNSYSRLNSLNVSRETYIDFEIFISMIIEKNKEINIISKESAKNDIIRNRHIIDSAQIIDFIDLNCNSTTDLGTGGGMPGIIIAIMLKKLKKDMKVNLYEKSPQKCFFKRSI